MASPAKIIFHLLAQLPLPLSHVLGWPFGLLFFILPNRHRRISSINIDLCFADKGWFWRRWLLLRSLVETSKTAMESPRLWLTSRNKLLTVVNNVSGLDSLEQALHHGKGVIIVGPHLGSWELVSLYCSAHYPMTSLYRPLRQRGLEDIVVSGRKRLGAKLVPTDASGVRKLAQALKNNELIGIPPDQDPRDSGGIFAPFFGIEANTMTLASRLALKSDARQILCVAKRQSWGRGFSIHFQPIESADGAKDDGVEQNITAINTGVETMVRQIPQQYQWGYKRFRSRPEGAPKIY